MLFSILVADLDDNGIKCVLIKFDNDLKAGIYLAGEELRKGTAAVLAENKLDTSERHAAVAKKANGMQGYSNKDVTSRDNEVIIPLYVVLVWPHLEYCVYIFLVPCYSNSLFAGCVE
ncbi:hypothetical protein QYF61_022057 [Mycteria americana]|uniref:Uncharacterized protein n=1 Tax=Mycteria americana TaxID=33587 RepID=A0AAN7MMP8_MYCAM|nr:hypothetical protein QYF61_022057 [Mycteria americana]